MSFRPVKLRRVVPVATAIGCLLLVLFGEPTPAASVLELSDVQQTAGSQPHAGPDAQLSGSARLTGRVIAANGKPIVAVPDEGLSFPINVAMLEKVRPLADAVMVVAGQTVNVVLSVANVGGASKRR